jgi:parallel beta-helix repeat protein
MTDAKRRCPLLLFFGLLICLQASDTFSATRPIQEIAVTNDFVLEKGATLSARLVIRASNLKIDGNGASLTGPGEVGDLKSLEEAGVGVLVEGATGVTIKNLKVRGFAVGLNLRHSQAIKVVGCDFSDNYHNPKHGWGELPPRGGILMEDVRHSVLEGNQAKRVWDGVHLVDCDDNLVERNDFSECSNTCAKLWKSSRNKFLRNNLSYGIRIDRAAGEVHARDSTCVLIETGSNDNYWYQNDITHGGDGVFIRPLNRWISRGNVFVENDTSYANNNCVESWSPGNTFIRNKANHGSYGFWLGGSDHTVLIGNEAAFNGLTNGYHNAPEPGFGHGGIVIVGGPSSHTIIDGNDLHDNRGAGLAFRGDVGTQGRKWATEHWVVQNNRMVSNQFGIWGQWGHAILLANNRFAANIQGNYLSNVTEWVDLENSGPHRGTPQARLEGPDQALAGEPVRFDASSSFDPLGNPLQYRWYLDGRSENRPTLERVFQEPGYHRVGLTVDNGGNAALAWKDLLVVGNGSQELGTEGQAGSWAYELESNEDGKGRVHFTDAPDALIGKRSLRFEPKPYPGAYATVIFPASKDARWNLSGKKAIRFWVKTLNPNIPGWQNAGPVVRLLAVDGQVEYKPAKDANLLNDAPYSEARWTWMPVVIPLAGNAAWTRTQKGTITLDRIDAMSLSLDSYGYDSFTVWLDGLEIE